MHSSGYSNFPRSTVGMSEITTEIIQLLKGETSEVSIFDLTRSVFLLFYMLFYVFIYGSDML